MQAYELIDIYNAYLRALGISKNRPQRLCRGKLPDKALAPAEKLQKMFQRNNIEMDKYFAVLFDHAYYKFEQTATTSAIFLYKRRKNILTD